MYTNKIRNTCRGLFCIFLFTISISSCDDFLSTKSDSTISQSTTYGSLSNTEAALTGIYGTLAGDNGYGDRLAVILPMATDAFETSGNYNCNDRRGISMYKPCSSDPELDDPFTQLYEGIERANEAIKYIPQAGIYKNGSASEQAQMKSFYGQALTLRAQFYYELIKNWGDLPAPFQPSADIDNLYLAKTDRDSIYTKILDDLKMAEDVVPWASESGVPATRINKGAVKGLRARIALAMGGYSLRRKSGVMERRDDYIQYYQIAHDECRQIMDSGEHALNPNFENVFRSLESGVNKDSNHELMFMVGAFGGHNKADSKLGQYNGLDHDQASTWPGGGGVQAIPTYFYEFNAGDVRRDVTIAPFHIDKNDDKLLSRSTRMTDGKFRKSWAGVVGPIQYTETKWPILRYADILLMFAETDNEINHGPSPQGIAAFNKVRQRAFAGNEDQITPAPTDYQGFFDAIVHQRLLEFGGEGLRKYDLIRWNLLGDKIAETRSKLREFMNGTGVYANAPEVIYAKPSDYDPANSAQTSVNTLNFFGRDPSTVFTLPTPAQSPPGDYTEVEWRSDVTDDYISSDTKGFAQYFQKNHSELLPIYEEIINENYNLDQDYGY